MEKNFIRKKVNAMKNIVLISENDSVKEFFRKMMKTNVNIISNNGIEKLVDYLNLCELSHDFVIDITNMPFQYLDSLVNTIPVNLKLTVIASIPIHYLPKDYKKILTSRPVSFFEYPLTTNILKDLNYN